MEEDVIIESLSPIERAIIPNIKRDYSSTESLALNSNQDKITTLRAVSFLKNKGLVEEKVEIKKKAILGILGIHYLKKGLPERVLLDKLIQKKIIPIGEIRDITGLNENEAKIALGILKRKGLTEIKEGRLHLGGKSNELSKKMIEELFLEKLPLEFEKLIGEDKKIFNELLSRKDIVEVSEEKTIFVKLTELGEKISSLDLKSDLIEQLTPEIIRKNSWKGKKFRRYDLTSPAPRIYGGKRHFVNQAKSYAKSIWLDMGFKEMTGNMVDTSFWVFDALFTAQDHPVREMQDTFYLKGLRGSLPNEKNILNEVRKAHEGGTDSSLGWNYKWNEEEAKKTLLRTHTTCLSVRNLREIAKNKEFPAKYFALGKCFRNETVDWSHGFEFNQTEGIVVDENANFRQLLGYLKEFFKKMGYEHLRIRPGYFAYTEPSLEIDVYHPVHKKWVELGGAGMFRPEVTIPLFGKHIPVLAWGPGFDRIIMEYFKITDLRDMYSNDIIKLRDMKFWRK